MYTYNIYIYVYVLYIYTFVCIHIAYIYIYIQVFLCVYIYTYVMENPMNIDDLGVSRFKETSIWLIDMLSYEWMDRFGGIEWDRMDNS